MSRTELFGLRPFSGLLAAAMFALAASAPRVASAQNPAPAARIKVERADELPRHVYPIDTTATALFQDVSRFAALAQRLEADLRADLATNGEHCHLRDPFDP